MHWYIGVLKKYVTFGGRARRMEYWMFVLISWLVSLVLTFGDTLAFGYEFGNPETMSPLSGIYSLLVLLPSIAVAVRRLHDTNRSGWWFLLIFVPILGWLVLFIFLVLAGTRGPNRFGLDPLNPDDTGDDVWPDVA